ncbi:DMT family transporter [Dongia sedimenti]|uniref:DMT family transporter n=1 Tax=Dongia sedimenti TaxID=3064282 RepID=A0ABU0YNK2_9PROT|nr:DMT family transporter [Rhodospirillaceae bacterium R-7]
MPSTALRRQPLLGLVYMAVAILLFSAMDAAAKWLTAGYSVVEIALLSRLLSPFLSLGVALHQGGLRTLRTRHPGWHLARATANGFTLVTFFAALIYLPLADTVAITFVSPLICCALAVPMLKEHVGPRRWIAIVIGFAGVLVITQPSGVGFGLGAALALGAALGSAFEITFTRRMSATESSQSILFWSSTLMIVAFGSVVPFAWTTPTLADLPAIAVLAVSGSCAQFCLVQAFRYGEVSMLVPLGYSGLIWATLFGYLFWGELPTLTVIGGVAIIVASSAYVAHREARVKGQATGPTRDLI